MNHEIYLDILFCTNFIIDYMILLSVKRFLSLSCRLRRLLPAAAAGGLCSFVILLPPLPSGLSLIISFACACFVVGAAFAPIPRKMFFKAAAAFFLISFGFCGIMMSMLTLFSPETLLVRNGSAYLDISPLMLVVSSLFCYVVLRVIMRITGSGRPKDICCTVRVKQKERSIVFTGRLDTGSTLKEPFSGLPVIVVKRSAYPEDGRSGDTSLRVVPFSSVGGEGLLYAFKADEITIINSGIKRRVSAYISLCDDEKLIGGEDAVIPYELIV